MPFYALVESAVVSDGYRGTFELQGERLLLVQLQGERHLVENRCGHFGVPMERGEIRDGYVECPQHYMRFSLRDGSILNPERCDDCSPIRVFSLIEQNGWLGVDLP